MKKEHIEKLIDLVEDECHRLEFVSTSHLSGNVQYLAYCDLDEWEQILRGLNEILKQKERF